MELAPDIWRFRDVQTVKDVIAAREQWIADAQAAVPQFRSTTSTAYFHVRVSTCVPQLRLIRRCPGRRSCWSARCGLV